MFLPYGFIDYALVITAISVSQARPLETIGVIAENDTH